jgi:hypothetical protein
VATTIQEATTHSDEGGLTWLHLSLKLITSGTTVAYTISGAPILKFVTQPFKTTGSTADVQMTYDQSTGAMTLGTLSVNDVIRLTVAY